MKGRFTISAIGALTGDLNAIAIGELLIREEDEGIGSCDENDQFQEQMADRIVENRGGYVSGRGGTGKSWMLKLLETKFKKPGVRCTLHRFHPRGRCQS